MSVSLLIIVIVVYMCVKIGPLRVSIPLSVQAFHNTPLRRRGNPLVAR